MEAELGCGNHNGLVGELEQLVTEYPLRERMWGQRMVALYRCGRQAESLRAYDELRVLLRDELGIPPSPLVQELNQAILNQDPSLDLQLPIQVQAAGATTTPEEPFPGANGGSFAVVVGAGGSSRLSQSNLRFPSRLVLQPLLPFSGREPQFASLLQACKETAAEGRRVVLVSGEAGIGKTRLAAEVARRAHDMGGRCCSADATRTWGALSALRRSAVTGGVVEPTVESLGRHGGELVRLVPELARIVPGLDPPLRADPETERYRLFDAVASWLEAISAETGLLLVLDDLHWAEKPTLLLLRHLVRSAEPTHVDRLQLPRHRAGPDPPAGRDARRPTGRALCGAPGAHWPRRANGRDLHRTGSERGSEGPGPKR